MAAPCCTARAFRPLPAVVLAAAVTTACSSDNESLCDTSLGSTRSAIVGGESVWTGPSAQPPVAAIRVRFSDGWSEDSLCSGVLVGARSVLTAAHCVPDEAGASDVSFDPIAPWHAPPDPCVTVETYEAATAAVHESLDLAILHLADVVQKQHQVDIASPNVEPGQQAPAAGYGGTENNSVGAVRFLWTRIVELNRGVLTVDSGGDSGACWADSGGPLFTETANGLVLVGILRAGSMSCTGKDEYTDVVAVRSWVSSRVY